ncbi:MAG: PKD domain-containing protein [Dehalococcoidia bacterium]|nr:PKD domain-containing protein [Dehalococcoidia bacterium]
MTRHLNHTVVVSLLALLVSVMALAYPSGGEAQTPDENRPRPDPGRPDSANVSVSSGPNGVTVVIRVAQQSPGTSGGTSSSSSVSTGSPRSCRISIHNIGHVLSNSPWYQEARAAHPNHMFGSVFCDDGFSQIVWIPIGTPIDANVEVVFVDDDAVDPVSVALELLNHIPIPDIAIEANPSTGLVALPSWFWIDGYDGAAISSSDSLGGVTVDVEVQPLHYRWSFGDGGVAETTSLGQRYPDESDIQHVYEQSSLATGGTYSITVEVTFAAQYRVNGGTWEALAPITRSFSNDYPVQQLQSVLVGQQP